MVRAAVACRDPDDTQVLHGLTTPCLPIFRSRDLRHSRSVAVSGASSRRRAAHSYPTTGAACLEGTPAVSPSGAWSGGIRDTGARVNRVA
jgi:hypothetical protein